MINSRYLAAQFQKAVIQFLHPLHSNPQPLCVFRSLNSQYLVGRYGYHSQRVIRPSRRYGQQDTVNYRDFMNYCKLLNDEPQVPIVKDLEVIFPDANQEFLNEHKIKAHIKYITTDFDFMEQKVRDTLINMGIEKPTVIQQVTIPLVLEGRDLISIAQTGSGKTLAFALPGLLHIKSQPKSEGPRVLVLAPTRELAMQIESQYKLFTKSVCLYGGASKQAQQGKLFERPDVIVATPGRLIDLVSDGYSLKSITQLVLDEADTMLDMGFEPQIRQIAAQLREDRQTLFFSATWPREVQSLARQLCSQDPEFVQIGDKGLSVNKMISQEMIVSGHNKFDQFINFMETVKDQKILIFCQRQIDTEKLGYRLQENGVNSKFIHGGLTQNERTSIIKDFRSGVIQCLIATNVAARGLDVKDVDLVVKDVFIQVNYDFPESIEDYIHRIGRTGRAGKTGKAVSFIEPRFMNERLKSQIVQVLKQSSQTIPSELSRY